MIEFKRFIPIIMENHESWGWNDLNVKEQLSKVKPISTTIQIRDEHDIYNILTNREKLECLLQEYEKKNNHKLERRSMKN